MDEMMTFHDTWEEFEKSYGFTDNEEVYTNGSRLIPSFRVKQWLDHLSSVESERKKGKWRHYEGVLKCLSCNVEIYDDIMEFFGDDVPKYCPNCGSYNGGEQTG